MVCTSVSSPVGLSLSSLILLGDIIYTNVLGRQMVILNTFAAARDTMGLSINSGRPHLVPQEL